MLGLISTQKDLFNTKLRVTNFKYKMLSWSK